MTANGKVFLILAVSVRQCQCHEQSSLEDAVAFIALALLADLGMGTEHFEITDIRIHICLTFRRA